ncbi:MAG: nitrile hydratase subunit alpha [Dehalococcoidia bacterium]|nr:nitrile hydratase subunit alpha [Dehalococcoidia bacterium]
MSDHDHDHEHDEFHNPTDSEIRAKAVESLLAEKGLLSTDAVDEIVDQYENNDGPMNGARVVARAWTDPEYKHRLLENGGDAVAELGYGDEHSARLVVVENTPRIHNVIVCTLCSCYPWSVLGLPPEWYKSETYRARVVKEPRVVLSEFGLELDDSIEVRVWDSLSELRYMVLPERPEGTDHMTEEELAALISRDAMIGVAKAGNG